MTAPAGRGFVRSEGGLLVPEVLALVGAGVSGVAGGGRARRDGLEGLAAADFGLVPGEPVGDAITRSWSRLRPLWLSFSELLAAQGQESESLSGPTRQRWLVPLFEELGFGRLSQQEAVASGERAYPVYSGTPSTPVHLVGAGVSLDRRSRGVRGAADQAPHGLVQELLNGNEQRLWGVVSNGLVLRLLRDNASLTRQAFVEFDLEGLFNAESYEDFRLLWLTVHASRFEPRAVEDTEDEALPGQDAAAPDPTRCWLEEWRRAGVQQGTRALDELRRGVEEAINELGRGFLEPAAGNGDLHHALRDGDLEPQEYYRQLLRLVYRLLFLFVAEDRDLLLAPGSDVEARDRYRRHYSTRQLRTLALRRPGGEHRDRYEQLRLVMGALHRTGEPALGLPALGSFLWAPESVWALEDARLTNRALFAAIRRLCSVEQGGVRREVDFRNLGSEELGSVYESLLELHPRIERDATDGRSSFELTSAAGHERKQTGAYYTPTSLIVRLLDSALEPVLDEAVEGRTAEDAEQAILALKVCDPACGSGHFLIAAAGRIARRLAAVRTGEAEPPPDAVRQALREVIGRCVYGVDVNEMAVELCKVSLWLEALEPGRALSLLDHHVVVGNSLLGTTPALIAGGVPDDAFKPITGDDRARVSELRKRNKRERTAHEGQASLALDDGGIGAIAAPVAAGRLAIEAAPAETVEQVEAQARKLEELDAAPELERLRASADAWCAAFVVEKTVAAPIITTDTVRRAQRRGLEGLEDEVAEAVRGLAEDNGFLHPHVAFPEVFKAEEHVDGPGWTGGFDVVLGNPPWERVKLQEKEFFAARDPEIAAAPNKAARDRLIKRLADSDPPLARAFANAKRQAEGASQLLRSTGRFPLCGRGDVNTYAVFAELMRSLLAPAGRVGVIVPTGIATDDTTKHFFADVIERGALVSLFDFENREAVFPGVHRSYKFCLLTLAGAARPSGTAGEFVFFATRPEHLDEPERRFELTAEDIALVNPNTKTCPIFRTRRDAEITKGIYRRVPVLVREGDPDGNPWGITFKRMFDMSNDSHLFRTRDQMEAPDPDDSLIGGPEVFGAGHAEPWQLEGNVFVRERRFGVRGDAGSDDDGDPGESSGWGNRLGAVERFLPLYEAKMINLYDDRWATYEPDGGGGYRSRLVTKHEKRDPNFAVLPRYWVPAATVEKALGDWAHPWLLGWRDITNATNERTLIAAMFNKAGVGNNLPISTVAAAQEAEVTWLLAQASSYAVDFVARFKVGGTHLNFFITQQLPFLGPELVNSVKIGDQALGSWVEERAVRLRTHADRETRARARAEIDAVVFRLFGLSADDSEYVLGTFPIVARRELREHGEFRTARLVRKAYNAVGALSISPSSS